MGMVLGTVLLLSREVQIARNIVTARTYSFLFRDELRRNLDRH